MMRDYLKYISVVIVALFIMKAELLKSKLKIYEIIGKNDQFVFREHKKPSNLEGVWNYLQKNGQKHSISNDLEKKNKHDIIGKNKYKEDMLKDDYILLNLNDLLSPLRTTDKKKKDQLSVKEYLYNTASNYHVKDPTLLNHTKILSFLYKLRKVLNGIKNQKPKIKPNEKKPASRQNIEFNYDDDIDPKYKDENNQKNEDSLRNVIMNAVLKWKKYPNDKYFKPFNQYENRENDLKEHKDPYDLTDFLKYLKQSSQSYNSDTQYISSSDEYDDIIPYRSDNKVYKPLTKGNVNFLDEEEYNENYYKKREDYAPHSSNGDYYRYHPYNNNNKKYSHGTDFDKRDLEDLISPRNVNLFKDIVFGNSGNHALDSLFLGGNKLGAKISKTLAETAARDGSSVAYCDSCEGRDTKHVIVVPTHVTNKPKHPRKPLYYHIWYAYPSNTYVPTDKCDPSDTYFEGRCVALPPH